MAVGHVLAVEQHLPCGRFDQAQQQAGRRRLARAGFADERERRASADVDAHVVDGADRRRTAVELLDQVAADEVVVGLHRRRHAGAGEDRPACARRGSARRRAVAWCTASVGSSRICAAGPCSTIRPCDITAMRSARSAATPRSWVISSTAAPDSRGQVVDVVQDPPLHRDVERAGRFVGDDEARPGGDGDGDQHPLAHSAGQLVRVLVGTVGVEAGARPGRRRASAWRRAGRPGRGCVKTSATWSPIRWTGLSDTRRVLRDQADVDAAERPPAALAETGEVDAVEADLPGADQRRGREQPDDGVSSRRLARTGLADHRQRLAGTQLQIDTAHRCDRAAPQPVVDSQSADAQQRLVNGVGSSRDRPTFDATPGGHVQNRSSRPWAMRLAASTVTATVSAGHRRQPPRVRRKSRRRRRASPTPASAAGRRSRGS